MFFISLFRSLILRLNYLGIIELEMLLLIVNSVRICSMIDCNNQLSTSIVYSSMAVNLMHENIRSLSQNAIKYISL